MTVSMRRVWRAVRPALPASRRHIRRARPDESVLLTQLERAASEAELGHVFDPHRYPYPTADVERRWQDLLHDPLTSVRILEVAGKPVGFVAFDGQTVLHLGVAPEQTRRGYGSALLRNAAAEIFNGGGSVARLWVLTENTTARRFYARLGWTDTGRRRACEFPPYPEELELSHPNPAPPTPALRDRDSA